MNFLIICIFFIIIIISLFLHKSSGSDPQFEACAPQMCGNQSISFPFFIQGQQQSYCGYPGFNITCQHHEDPVLLISKQFYIIDQIFYETRSLRVKNEAFGASDGCKRLGQISNFTQGNRFELVDDDSMSRLILLSKCSVPGDEEEALLSRYRVDCDDGGKQGSDWVLAMHGNDEGGLRNGSKVCKEEVVVPVAVEGGSGGGGGGNYTELLKRGFVMKWTASNCTECKQSGGRCGFDEKNYQFQCYCLDRPHFRWCNAAATSKLP